MKAGGKLASHSPGLLHTLVKAKSGLQGLERPRGGACPPRPWVQILDEERQKNMETQDLSSSRSPLKCHLLQEASN